MQKSLNAIKMNILKAAYDAKEGHVPSAFSILDILWILYDQIMIYDTKDLQSVTRDRFILSKGHASLGLYAILAAKGFFDESVLCTFGKYDSFLGGHPDRNKVPGVEASTGSLGHGLPIGVGMAMSMRIKKNISSRVFVLIGDGEANEGTIWEAALLAAHHKLSNLCCIVDHNHSTDRALGVGDLCAKFHTFDWKVHEVDGHSHEQLFDSLSIKPTQKPTVVIANTLKGKGCLRMEGNPAWHHKAPTSEELKEILEELN